MSVIDLVFEGGGAKGMVFVGALDELFRGGSHAPGRLIGTSAGAITAVMLAAGYTPAEMLVLLGEKDASGKPVFQGFLAEPAPFDADAIHQSSLRKLLADIDLPLVPGALENRLDDLIADRLAASPAGCHLFSFLERGGWYSADPVVAWMERLLNEGQRNGSLRQLGSLTFKEFHAVTGVEMTLTTADTTATRLLLLNHRTAPSLPVVWAARMSMSVPLLWQEVVWRAEWGTYAAWDAELGGLVEQDMTGHTLVDGGLLSNFPIALLLADRPDVAAVVGPSTNKNVLGLLIDESLPVANRPQRIASGSAPGVADLPPVQRIRRLMNTALGAHDNMAIAVFGKHVVRLPAAGYGTTQFDMNDAERDALIAAGRSAMRSFLARQTVLEATGVSFAPSSAVKAVANEAAQAILAR